MYHQNDRHCDSSDQLSAEEVDDDDENDESDPNEMEEILRQKIVETNQKISDYFKKQQNMKRNEIVFTTWSFHATKYTKCKNNNEKVQTYKN